MVTFAQAQERAEEWINGDLPSYQHREVRVREFELGFVVWAEDRADGPRSDGGAQRLVIARDSGEATLWPALPVGEVIRRYEEEYGRADAVPEPAAAPPARVDLNQTSFLLTPPEWLQEAADRIGTHGGRGGALAGSGGAGSVGGASADGGSVGGGSVGGGSAGGAAGVGGLAETLAGPPAGSGPGSGGVPEGATPWSGTDTNPGPGEDRSVPLPETVFAPPLSGDDTAQSDAQTALMSGGSQLPSTAVSPALGDGNASGGQGGQGGQGGPGGPGGTPPPGAPSYGYPQGAGGPGTPPPPPSYGYPQGGGGTGSTPPPPPGAPSYGYPQGAGGPGSAPPPSAGATPPPPPGAPSYGYPQGAGGPGTPPPSGAPAGAAGLPHAPGAPGAPGRPSAPNAADIADAATSKAAPPRARGGATPPPPPGAPGMPGGSAGGPPASPATPAAPGSSGGAYVPTQLVSSLGPDGPEDVAGPGAPQGAGAPNPPGPPNPPGLPQPPGAPGAPGMPGAPQPPGAPNSPGTPPGGVHHAATVFADPSLMGGAPQPPGAPGAPQGPGAQNPQGPGAPNPPGPPNPPGIPNAPGTPGAPGMPGAPQPPGAPGVPGAPGSAGPGAPGSSGGAAGAVHHAETVLAGPAVGGPGGPGVPPPPQAPGAPGMPPAGPGMPPPGAPGAPGAPAAPGMAGAPGMPGAAQPPMPPGAFAPPPGQPGPGQPGLGQPGPGHPGPGQPGPGQPSYGYPPQPIGQPTVGPGYQAVLRYRAQDGSEQQLIRRSAPGTPHPEWQIFHELRGMNVPPDQVLELHTELESCELPGAYCARMIREQWPQARITSIAPYGTDHASRQQGMQQLLAHQGELHEVADGPARPAPVRAPLPQVQAAPPIPPEGVAQELAGAFGPGLFRFEQAAVSRQGVPPVVAHSLVVGGLPMDMGPFFWAQAQPGRPVPTLAELAQERGVQPASDAGSYLVMGSDFGKAVCVQYGTANIVAVPVEAGPGGAPVPPQFVNTGLPEFQRCLALLGRMWRLRFGLNQEQAGRWTVDFQAQLAALDPAALGSPESWWSVLLEQMWDGLL
ncbi:SUKH-4 family immunity protein [Streptomyces chartreusis]|uniref:SUKH-4 family immunity protein n=1 Tax=Streptomyces chartreusis TaxID=1969 RepID=UPI00382B3017